MSEPVDASPSQPHRPLDSHSKQGALVSRYQSTNAPHEPSEVLFVREIMTIGVVTAPPTSSLADVALLFSERRYRHLPIVSANEKIVGLLSDRDVLRHQVQRRPREEEEEQVESIMVSEVLVATPDTLIRDVARTMFQERIGCLPIVDERSSLVGIVTRSDIMRALIAHGPIRLWA